MASGTRRRRPASVTAVVVLTWLAAIGAVLSGILILTLSDEQLALAALDPSTATTAGWTEIILGVVTALVALGLSSGSRLSRFLVTVLMLMRAVAGLWVIVALPAVRVSGVLTVALSVLVLFLLWNQRASAFFAAR